MNRTVNFCSLCMLTIGFGASNRAKEETVEAEFEVVFFLELILQEF